MTRSWGSLAARSALVALAGALVALVVAPVAGAASTTTAPTTAAAPRVTRTPPPPPPPPPGWDATRVRFEPLDGSSPLALAGHGSYRGAVEVARDGAGLGAVDDLPLEDYVKGIAEVPTDWPLEAQKAQAIAARTYAVWSARQDVATEYRAVGADICATDACQVYAGLTRELRDDHAANWTEAVEETQGQVLAYRNAPIKAKYSSSNGGHIVPGDQPYLRGGDDPDDRYSPLHEWHVTVPLDDVAQALSLPARPIDVRRDGDVVRLTLPDPDPDAAASGATVESDVAAVDFRSQLDSRLAAPAGLPMVIPSMQYGAHTADGAVVIDGGGWGHGIGMSQYGALGKALRGMRAPDILAAYYAGLKPVLAPAGWLPARIRAAVALGDAVERVSGGRFRVIADGKVLAHAATGEWTVQPRGGSLRVIPPPDQAGPVSVEQVETVPASITPASAPQVRLRLSAPAVVAVTATPPGGAPLTVQTAALHDAGPLDVVLPAPGGVGDYTVDVVADAGGGRVTELPITLVVTPPPAPGPPAAHTGGGGRASRARTGARPAHDHTTRRDDASAMAAATSPVTHPAAWLAIALLAGVGVLLTRQRRRAAPAGGS